MGAWPVDADRDHWASGTLDRMLGGRFDLVGGAGLGERAGERSDVRADARGGERRGDAGDRDRRCRHRADGEPGCATDRCARRRTLSRVLGPLVTRGIAADRVKRMLPWGSDVERTELMPRETRSAQRVERVPQVVHVCEPGGNQVRHWRVSSRHAAAAGGSLAWAIARRSSTLGSRIDVRYLVTVRRATRSPCSASSRASCASENGSRGFSCAISSLTSARIAVAEQAPPFSVASWREKKRLNSNMQRGVAMYLPLVTRHTVDSCSPSSAATCLRPSGFIATSPYSKNARCFATNRCSMLRMSQRASCSCRDIWTPPLRPPARSA